MTSHLIQRPAAFYAFTLFLEIKSSYKCEKAADVCVVIIVVLSVTNK